MLSKGMPRRLGAFGAAFGQFAIFCELEVLSGSMPTSQTFQGSGRKTRFRIVFFPEI